MSEKNTVAVALLRSLSRPTAGAEQIAKDLHVSQSNLIELIARLGELGLLDTSPAKTSKAGRPKRLMMTTPSGLEYLAHERMEMKTLKSRRSDLRKAVSGARYAARLAAGGASPCKLFLELSASAQRF